MFEIALQVTHLHALSLPILSLNVKSRTEVQLTQMSTNGSTLGERMKWKKPLHSKFSFCFLRKRILHFVTGQAHSNWSRWLLKALALSKVDHSEKVVSVARAKCRREDRRGEKSSSRGKHHHHHHHSRRSGSKLEVPKRGTSCLASQLTYQFSTQVGRKSARCQLCMRASELDLCALKLLSRNSLLLAYSYTTLRNLTCKAFQSWSWMVNDFVAPFQALFWLILASSPSSTNSRAHSSPFTLTRPLLS